MARQSGEAVRQVADIKFDDFGEIRETAVQKPPRRDALAAALKGVMPVDSPLTDPLWMTPEQQATREAVRAVVDRWKAGSFTGGHDDYNYIEVPGPYSSFGKHEYVHAAHFIPAMERKAYELLLRGNDERSIAVDCYMTIDEVHEVAERHGLQK